MATKRTRAEVEAELAEIDAAEAEEEVEYSYELWEGDRGIKASSKSPVGRKIPKYLKERWNFDIADEPVQDDDAEPEGKDKPKPGRQQAQGGTVKAFQRRIS